MITNILLVGIGSMIGGISRYLLSDYIRHLFPSSFPLGTFIVNIIGCFLIGIISGLLLSTINITNNHRLLLAVGFCGSFTTFSTFSLENLSLFSSKAYLLLALNIILSTILGFAATWAGYMISMKNR